MTGLKAFSAMLLLRAGVCVFVAWKEGFPKFCRSLDEIKIVIVENLLLSPRHEN